MTESCIAIQKVTELRFFFFFFTDREVEVVCEASFKTTVSFSFLSGAHF